MLESQARRLKELNSDYYHGLLGWERYRTERGWLLDSLESVDGEDTAAQVDRAAGGGTPLSLTSGASAQDTSGQATGSGSISKGVLVGAAVIAGVIVIAVVGWMLSALPG